MAAVIEGMPGELDIFERPIMQTGILGGNWMQYKPTSFDADAAQLEFRVPGQGDYYIDLGRTLLDVKVKIVKANGENFDDADGIGPVNNLFDTLWSNVKVEFNQKVVSDARNMYHYRAYIEDLFNFNNTAKDSHLTASLWDTDDPGQLDAGNTNTALVRRKAMTDGSCVFNLAGQLHCDLFNTSKYLLNGIDIRFVFIKNKVESLLMKIPAADMPKVKVVDSTLWLRKIKVNPSILIAHAKNLSSHTAKYPFKRVEMHNYTIPSGSQFHTIENMFLGRIPNRLIVGLVSHSAFSGDFTKNPFNFQHYNTNYLTLFKNGEQMFSRAYSPVYAEKDYSYAMPYLQSFINTGNHLSDDGYCISMKDWQNGFALYPFDLTPDLSAHEQHWCIQEQGNLRLELGFKVALTEAVTVIVYAEFRDVLEIDKTRECSLDYVK